MAYCTWTYNSNLQKKSLRSNRFGQLALPMPIPLVILQPRAISCRRVRHARRTRRTRRICGGQTRDPRHTQQTHVGGGKTTHSVVFTKQRNNERREPKRTGRFLSAKFSNLDLFRIPKRDTLYARMFVSHAKTADGSPARTRATVRQRTRREKRENESGVLRPPITPTSIHPCDPTTPHHPPPTALITTHPLSYPQIPGQIILGSDRQDRR